MASYKIDQRNLIVEMKAADPVLKRVADQVMREAFFLPAVEQMQAEFEAHPVTQELEGGIHASNTSNTLDAPFKEGGGGDDDDTSPPNLTSFIGFDQDPESILGPIRNRFSPDHPDGPKMVYRGRDKEKLRYQFEIRAPSEESIYNDTPLPWAEGISWAKRIEQGISGIGQFLNVFDRPSSRSGGGIQIEGKLRSGRFKPTSYLTRMFNNFLRRASGRSGNGRAP